jgi:hypothetical protein
MALEVPKTFTLVCDRGETGLWYVLERERKKKL